MSFMFNPHPYDDPDAVNVLPIDELAAAVCSGVDGAAAKLVADAAAKGGRTLLRIDGYPTADFNTLVGAVKAAAGDGVTLFSLHTCLRPAAEIAALLTSCLPTDLAKDPVLLYGRVFSGSYGDLYDADKVAALIKQAESAQGFVIVYGHGAASPLLDVLGGKIAWIDITPKQAVLRTKAGLYQNLGADVPAGFKATMRRSYYCDFILSEHLRGKLLHDNRVDYYLCGSQPEHYALVDGATFGAVLDALVRTPYRARPVYIEGVWGGQYMKKLRRMPDTIKNVAWSFELIPLEVSVVTRFGGAELEFPHHTFVQARGDALMGEDVRKQYGGYFPIRFNYDDTWHSNGNMSIQVHSGEQYNRENFNEFGRQDESYYIVATGHDAMTYCGFKDGADVDQFFTDIKRSETDKTPVDYKRYVHAETSVPGKQFMLPAGTIHASGRNQVILEIGSLTIGSYTYKLYDYLRLDLDGVPRPIHTYHGERVIDRSRTAESIQGHLIHKPKTLRRAEGFEESVVGRCDELYFELRRIDLIDRVEDDTQGHFVVLSLVDGETAVVRSVNNPAFAYTMNYLDIVVVPASVGAFEVINVGKQPAVLHKTLLKR